MRNPMKKKSVVNTSAEELEKRSEIAGKLGENAPLKYTTESTDVKTSKVNSPKKKDLLNDIAQQNIFGKKNSEKRKHNFKMNRYEKAALYIIAKKNGMSMHQYLQKEFIAKVTKQAENIGFDEDTAMQVYKENLLK